MNSTEFHCFKMDEDPQEFIEGLQKSVDIIGVTPVENVELAAYQLKGVAQVWFNQWKEERVVDVGPLDWGKFMGTFLDQFFPLK